MANTASGSWMPAAGRYSAKVGKSLTRVIKARKGEPPQKSKFPEPDFYTFRYNFIPPSVDSTKPGSIEIKKGQDVTSVTVERANSQAGGEGGHVFIGNETTAKEWDCLLIYDEQLGSFTLEKIDSSVGLTYDKKTSRPPRQPGASVPSSRPSTSTSTSSSNTPLAQSHPRRPPQTAAERLEEELERTLLGEDEDAIGESDDEIAALLPPEPSRKPSPARQDPTPPSKPKVLSFKKNVPRPGSVASTKQKVIASKQEEEESEGEIIEPPKAKATSSAVAPPRKPPAKPKTTKKSIAEHAAAIRANAKTQPIPPSGSPTALAPPVHPLPPKPLAVTATPPARPSTKVSPSKKREPPIDTPVVQPPSKKIKSSPPPRPALLQRLPASKPAPKLKEISKKEKEEAVSLALPGSEGVSLPSALELPGQSQPLVTEPVLPGDDSESEEWDPVVEASPPVPVPVEQPSRRLVMEEIIPEPTAHPLIPNPVSPEEDEDEEDYEAVEIDEDIFGQELEAIIPDDEDDEAMEPVEPIEPHFSGPPLSFGDIAGNTFVEGDESDEYSSSDDSE